LENKLRRLYELQQIDLRLDELEDLKGDLPSEIQKLEENHSALSSRLAALEETMRTAFSERDTADTDIIALKEKMEKYRKQQFAVRNNREYDALTREMDTAAETIARLEKTMEALETKATVARTGIEELKKQVEALEAQLEEKRAALEEVSRSTEEEELQFQHKRDKVLVHVTKPDLAAYERIRRAKKGKAVVPVKRGACGGCFARVTPQKLLELRQNNKIYQCEHCGRILVSDEIVGSAEKFE
jgi:predicted  nucleic acid-binding Zn-ribbon protein